MGGVVSIQWANLLLLLACCILVIWSLIATGRSLDSMRAWRVRVGIASSSVGVGSAVLFFLLYGYVWINHALPAHGLTLWAYFLTGLGLSVAGIALGLMGEGHMRHSSILISLVTTFEWLRELAEGRRARRLAEILMWIAIALFGIALIAFKRFSATSGTSQSPPPP